MALVRRSIGTAAQYLTGTIAIDATGLIITLSGGTWPASTGIGDKLVIDADGSGSGPERVARVREFVAGVLIVLHEGYDVVLRPACPCGDQWGLSGDIVFMRQSGDQGEHRHHCTVGEVDRRADNRPKVPHRVGQDLSRLHHVESDAQCLECRSPVAQRFTMSILDGS